MRGGYQNNENECEGIRTMRMSVGYQNNENEGGGYQSNENEGESIRPMRMRGRVLEQ